MNYTRGKYNSGLTVPANASKLSQFINHEGEDKFAAHNAPANGHTGPLAMDIPFNRSYVIRQTAFGGGKDGVKLAFVDAHGNTLGTAGHDQDAPASITRQQFDSAGGLGHVFFKIDYVKAGEYAFQGGGN